MWPVFRREFAPYRGVDSKKKTSRFVTYRERGNPAAGGAQHLQNATSSLLGENCTVFQVHHDSLKAHKPFWSRCCVITDEIKAQDDSIPCLKTNSKQVSESGLGAGLPKSELLLKQNGWMLRGSSRLTPAHPSWKMSTKQDDRGW